MKEDLLKNFWAWYEDRYNPFWCNEKVLFMIPWLLIYRTRFDYMKWKYKTHIEILWFKLI